MGSGAGMDLAVRVQRSRRFQNNEFVKWGVFIANFVVIVLVSTVRAHVTTGTSSMLHASSAIGLLVPGLVGFAKVR
jgi:hypothetical protein